MYKILFYHLNFPAGGTEKITINIAKQLPPQQYEIHIITSKKTSDFKLKQLQNIIEIPYQKSAFEDKEAINFIIKYLNEKKIDLFVLPAKLSIQLCLAVRQNTTCKIIFALHSMPLWEVQSLLYRKKDYSQGCFYKELYWYTTYIKANWLNYYDKRFITPYQEIYNLVDSFVVLCTEYKRKLEKKFRCNKKLVTIPNPQELPSQINLNKKKQIIFSGRLSYDDKRVDRLLLIWKKCQSKLPDWELIIIGDGEEKSKLQTFSQKLKLKRITFTGYMNDMEPFYQNAAIICLTSNFEGWPLCLTEAQAYGVIPIAFNCSAGVQAILGSKEERGILIPPNNLKQFSKQLLTLANDPLKMKKIQQNILNFPQNSPEIIGKKWTELFNRLLKNLNT